MIVRPLLCLLFFVGIGWLAAGSLLAQPAAKAPNQSALPSSPSSPGSPSPPSSVDRVDRVSHHSPLDQLDWAALPGCELVPLPGQQLDFLVDGHSRLRWQHGDQSPRPYFFPWVGPGGTSLLRLGHPGAPDHDHHRGIWFAHHDVDGLSFWADGQGNTIRQTQWYVYQESDQRAIMAVQLSWRDADDQERLQQQLIAVLTPQQAGQMTLELQSDFRPGAGRDSVQLGKTNFGLLAVRVARSLSHRYGGGQLANSEGDVGETACFGKPARWMDYSGPLAVAPTNDLPAAGRSQRIQGITYFDHPDNPHYPSHWHVRADGWMGAAFNLQSAVVLTADRPLRLRYLLWLHEGGYDAAAAERVHQAFAESAAWSLQPSTDGLVHYRIESAEQRPDKK